MAKDINKLEFNEGTKLKLDIFRKCFREWYPVFLYNKYIDKLFIYDMFAGSGKDAKGNVGSPLILLEEAKGNDRQYCKHLKDLQDSNSNTQSLRVVFGFNEYNKKKLKALKLNIDAHIEKCQSTCPDESCILKTACNYVGEDFASLIRNPNLLKNLANNRYAKFILLDQYGFKQITNDVFLQLVNAPKTDFIFFIASSFINRFKTLPAVSAYFKEMNISLEKHTSKECHRVITDYFRTLIPAGKEYYLHSFTFKKRSNYYGLIFGTNHTLGMEKFLRVCWQEDPLSGDSNCYIDNDFKSDELFYEPNDSNKKKNVSTKIKDKILDGTIRNNIMGLKCALMHGCKPDLYVQIITDMKDKGEVVIVGRFNKISSDIHKIKEDKIYHIKVK
jgi:three-Cys-motif partner protein